MARNEGRINTTVVRHDDIGEYVRLAILLSYVSPLSSATQRHWLKKSIAAREKESTAHDVPCRCCDKDRFVLTDHGVVLGFGTVMDLVHSSSRIVLNGHQGGESHRQFNDHHVDEDWKDMADGRRC